MVVIPADPQVDAKMIRRPPESATTTMHIKKIPQPPARSSRLTTSSRVGVCPTQADIPLRGRGAFRLAAEVQAS